MEAHHRKFSEIELNSKSQLNAFSFGTRNTSDLGKTPWFHQNFRTSHSRQIVKKSEKNIQ